MTHGNGALSHLRVLDLTHWIAGPYCTKLMAGFGAEVIKIERPVTGDPLRGVGPFVKNQPGLERGIPFLWFNTGKKSVTLDLKSRAGVDLLKHLVRGADVVIENFAPRVMPALGLSYEVLREINPRIVMTSISNFGQSGPYRDYQAEEITEYAMSGLMYATGDPDRAPLAAGPAVTQLTAGMNAYIATLMACFRRERSGLGEWIDLSIHEAALDNFEIAVAEYLHLGKVAKRRNDNHPLVPWQTYPCRDGDAAILGGPVRYWRKAVSLFEEPRLVKEKYAHMADRIENREDIRNLMAPWLLKHDRKEIFHAGQARNLAFGYLATLADVFESPQNLARGFFVKTDHPEIGEYTLPGAPFRPEKTPWHQARAPRLGEHTDAVRGMTGSVERPTGPETRDHAMQRHAHPPLDGIRIIDLTHDWAGPHATRLMADYGAEVIKIEYLHRLDGMRGAYTENRAHDKHPRWWEINRNKGSVTLDLHLPSHIKAFQDLVKISDVVVENSRPGVMDRWGLGYEVLKAIRPDIILVSMSAFGATGPESHYAGYGGCIEALSGVQALTGYAREERRMRVREVDVTNGSMGACAIMTALIHRQRTGEGQWVDLSERESSAWLIGEHLLEFRVNGTQTLPIGNRHPYHAPQGCYRCAGDDRWFVLSIRSDREWKVFCGLAAHPEWAEDPRFTTVSERRRNHDLIDALIEGWSSGYAAQVIVNRLQGASLAAGWVANARDIGSDPHLNARSWFVQPEGCPRYPGFPFRFNGAGGRFIRRGPDLGADNEAILHDRIGMSDVPKWTDADIGTAFDLED